MDESEDLVSFEVNFTNDSLLIDGLEEFSAEVFDVHSWGEPVDEDYWSHF